VTFLGILAVAYLPFVVLILIATGSMGSASVHTPDEAVQRAVMYSMTMFGFSMLILIIAMPLGTGALTRAIGSTYLGETISLGGSYRYVFNMFFRFFFTTLLSGLVIAIGFVLLVIPGIVFLIWFIFTSSVCILEGSAGTAAMGRSRQLARGHAGRIICLAILIWILNLLISQSIRAFNSHVLPALMENGVLVVVTGVAVEQCMNLLVAPFLSIAWVLLYYDIRIRKEGFDLEVLARSLGAAPPKPSAAPPTAP
jgi:hypothetical protein